MFREWMNEGMNECMHAHRRWVTREAVMCLTLSHLPSLESQPHFLISEIAHCDDAAPHSFSWERASFSRTAPCCGWGQVLPKWKQISQCQEQQAGKVSGQNRLLTSLGSPRPGAPGLKADHSPPAAALLHGSEQQSTGQESSPCSCRSPQRAHSATKQVYGENHGARWTICAEAVHTHMPCRSLCLELSVQDHPLPLLLFTCHLLRQAFQLPCLKQIRSLPYLSTTWNHFMYCNVLLLTAGLQHKT